MNANLFSALILPNLPSGVVAADSRLSVITNLFTEASKVAFWCHCSVLDLISPSHREAWKAETLVYRAMVFF